MTIKKLPQSLSASAQEPAPALRNPNLITSNSDCAAHREIRTPRLDGESSEIRNQIILRPYQFEAFKNRTNGLEVWMWGRQTGKSFTLAAWAVSRLIERPGRLVTILSNSLANGAELNRKCAQIARHYTKLFASADLSSALEFDCMSYETRLQVGDAIGRIKILPANPRTARGFSGDLILDEFAFHENSAAIWEAAEPILSANPDFLCRIASTPNGRHNMFYRLITDPSIPKRIVPRSEAWRQGLIISHPVGRQPITPDEARALAHDKRAYDQNYECIFESENMTLLTDELISSAEDPSVGVICDDTWSPAVLSFLCNSDPTPNPFNGGATLPQSQSETSSDEPILTPRLDGESSAIRNLYAGIDVGRSQDLTVISVIEKEADMFFVRALLRLRNVRLPQQQEFLETVCRSPRFAGALIDMTGLGLGLYEYTHQQFGSRIQGLNFASSIPVEQSRAHQQASASALRVPVPEALALRLLQTYESKRIRHPIDPILREDLRKPERITTPEGRVSIVASRTESGHADHFWSLALAVRAATSAPPSACATSISVPGRTADLRWARNLPRVSALRRRGFYF